MSWIHKLEKLGDAKIEHVFVSASEKEVTLVCIMEGSTEAVFRSKAVLLTQDEARALGKKLIDCASGSSFGDTFGDVFERLGWKFPTQEAA